MGYTQSIIDAAERLAFSRTCGRQMTSLPAGVTCCGSVHDPHDPHPLGPWMGGLPVLSCPGVHVLVGELQHQRRLGAVRAPSAQRPVQQPPGDLTDRCSRAAPGHNYAEKDVLTRIVPSHYRRSTKGNHEELMQVRQSRTVSIF